jgi:transposase InsO family protein
MSRTALPADTHAERKAERELVTILGLAASQLEVSVRDTEQPVATLGRAIAALGAAAEVLDGSLQQLPDGGPCADARRLLVAQRDALRRRADEAAIALQFHDRLVQRLTHVRDSLAALGDFVDARAHRGNAADWEALRRRIRDQYSMEQERVMLDLLVSGATPEQVLRALQDLRRGGAAGHVDLF